MIDYRHFYAACKLADPDVTIEFGHRWMYLVPKQVTREHYEAYIGLVRAYGFTGCAPATERLGFYVQAWWLPNNMLRPVLKNMPFNWKAYRTRPTLSSRFKRLEQLKSNIMEYDRLYERHTMHDNLTALMMARLYELSRDQDFMKWARA